MADPFKRQRRLNGRTPFSDRLAAARESKHLTQARVARSVGVSEATVSFWESGRFVPRLAKLSKLSRLYGASIDELVHGAPDL